MMSEYIKFWLAQHLVGFVVSVLACGILIAIALIKVYIIDWLRGIKYYKER